MKSKSWEALLLGLVVFLDPIFGSEASTPASNVQTTTATTSPTTTKINGSLGFENSFLVSANPSVSSSNFKNVFKKESQWKKLNLHLEQDFFYSNNTELLSRGSHQQLLKLGLDIKLQSPQKSHSLDLNYFYSEFEKEHYFNFREWNYTQNISKNQKITFGRKLHDWSRADQEWQLGLWQPRFMWSRIRPEQNGLTGLFYSWSQDQLQFQALASPVFVPEMGPRFSFRNGTFQSGNPWFKAPAKRATVEGFFEDREIVYGLNIPNIQELVAQNSLALQGRWAKEGSFCQTSYAYKPINGIFHSVDLVLRIDIPSAPPGVEVHPYSEYHRLFSAECGYDSEVGIYGFVSFTQDNPLRQNLPDHWISKRLQKMTLASGLVGYKWSHHDIYLSSMSLSGGDDLDTGTKASDRESFFETWYNYVQAFRVGYTARLNRSHRTELQAAITWDNFQQGWSWTSGFQTGLTKTLEVFVRLDGVALAESSRSEGRSEFLNTFKTNDQASAGVYLVF